MHLSGGAELFHLSLLESEMLKAREGAWGFNGRLCFAKLATTIASISYSSALESGKAVTREGK